MGGAVALTLSVYLLNQDWLQTILYPAYVGFYYVAYLAVALGFMGDAVLNQARLTTVLLGAVLSALAVFSA